MPDDELVQEARKAAESAYCVYSNFPVGSAVIAEDGKLYLGCNIENASYGLTVCAERVAIFNAVAAGNRRIKKLATTCLKGDKSQPGSLMSCGACRQVISEFLEDDGRILVDGIGSFTMDEYLPLRFKLPEIK
jgi:cytidine deaminase